jgi:hypothetical protein
LSKNIKAGNKIDEMVYRLYDLTDEEIAFIEGKTR